MGSDDRSPSDQEEESPDSGPAMSQSGAEPAGPETGWETSQPNPDATRSETMPSSSDDS